MVLLYQIVQVFRGSNFGPRAGLMVAENFPRRSMGRPVAAERDLMRHPVVALERPPEKRFDGRDIPLGAEREIDRLSLLADSAIEVSPAAFDLHLGLVDAPRGAGPACKMPSTRVRFLKRRVCGDYAPLQPFAPEPID